MRRSDNKEKTYDRRDGRVVHEEWCWYYHTREGRRGPFDTRNEALVDLDRYVDTMNFIETNPDAVPDNLDFENVDVIDLKPPRY